MDIHHAIPIPPTFNFKPTPGGPKNDVEAVALHWACNPVQTVPDILHGANPKDIHRGANPILHGAIPMDRDIHCMDKNLV